LTFSGLDRGIVEDASRIDQVGAGWPGRCDRIEGSADRLFEGRAEIAQGFDSA
jgi:hypothetical protein